ncbi:uncharacterized protein FFUJ_05212 [Fusarium fujikuroi IMI 58289]|uniref:Apple domain-containing protein n=1 Tax=Gibberella fujikuroi (strain CBS 195.34 / IMI 58289 / NRRL A-6831) TaxID=1279085 RepID=S0DST9_GIBF5|nr:uncharacterized protein FFUJ_05212 [Fusarium fujikuroi IMI 58289]CCT63638.1 uncharacterized protein FFUJ_05212 [Fusarium fujikuroi IMI 58289]SCN98289.1 uncharacterized protein FFM5_06785 [Fusarium fujikuroi]
MVALKSIVFFLAFGTEALGATTDVICQSKYGTKSVASNKVPRATTTVMNQITVIKRVIRKVNVVVVPKAKTTTETETVIRVTTTSVDSDVETATETETGEFTEIEASDLSSAECLDIQTTNRIMLLARTSTSVSSTTTTKYSTSTIAAPSGFVPIKEVKGYIARVKARGPVPRATTAYLQRIDCTKKIPSTTTKTVTTTVKGARITLKPKTVTKMATSFMTITVTEHGPQVTETETVTALRVNLAQRTQTQTIPETVTVESIVPADPFYAACSSNNLASTANGGKRIADFDAWVANRPIYISGLTSAYACCVECQKKQNCLMSRSSAGGASCWLYLTPSDDACSAQINWLTYRTDSGSLEWTYSNGPCGRAINGQESS